MPGKRIVRTPEGASRYGVDIGQPIPKNARKLSDTEARLEHSPEGILFNTHKANQCAGEFCTIHNRSDHCMRSFPQYWRSDRGIMERICPCGIGHPDPDSPWPKGSYQWVHGCCGHCRPGMYEELQNKSFKDNA